MAQVARWHGALVAHTEGRYFLIGNTEGPADFAEGGFEAPAEPVDARKRPYIELKAVAPVPLEPTVVRVDLEGMALVTLLVERLLVDPTGSVSDRLWNMLIGETGRAPDVPGELEANWFVQQPKRVWDVVRDKLLR